MRAALVLWSLLIFGCAHSPPQSARPSKPQLSVEQAIEALCNKERVDYYMNDTLGVPVLSKNPNEKRYFMDWPGGLSEAYYRLAILYREGTYKPKSSDVSALTSLMRDNSKSIGVRTAAARWLLDVDEGAARDFLCRSLADADPVPGQNALDVICLHTFSATPRAWEIAALEEAAGNDRYSKYPKTIEFVRQRIEFFKERQLSWE